MANWFAGHVLQTQIEAYEHLEVEVTEEALLRPEVINVQHQRDHVVLCHLGGGDGCQHAVDLCVEQAVSGCQQPECLLPAHQR